MRDGSEYHLVDRLFRLERCGISPDFCFQLVATSAGQKSCQVSSLDTRCTRSEPGKETCWSQTEELEPFEINIP